MTIPDFSDNEIEVIRQAVENRWRDADVELHLADVEAKISPASDVTECPAVFWQNKGCNFILLKTGEQTFRCHFFYRADEQFGTGIEEYDDLNICITSLLQIQADDESVRSGAFPEGKTAERSWLLNLDSA